MSSIDQVFAALADPTRRAILEQLAKHELTVSELAEPFAMSLPAVSKHLRVLEKAGLLVQEKDGRLRRCRLVASPLEEASSWLDRYRPFWETQLDSLATYLEQLQPPDKENPHESCPNKNPNEPQIPPHL